jgi:xanthine/CO dehydrogenase XdhC/CoxF family maturation factor
MTCVWPWNGYIFQMENNNTHKPVDDLDAINTALGWIKEGRTCALATVTRTWGSAPRPTGSFLAINDQGAFVGSVSGGCIEGEVATEALGLMRNGGFKTSILPSQMSKRQALAWHVAEKFLSMCLL